MPSISAPPFATYAAFHNSSSQDDGSGWERMWSGGLAPGQAFDAAKPEAALLALLPSNGGFSSVATGLEAMGKLNLAGKAAFVPGCGRGYAVAALAQLGGCSSVVGLEVSATAQAACAAYLADTGADAAGATCAAGDFFAHRGQYDLVYDCTFLCAIPADRRVEWAAQMAALLKPGTGELVTLIFPVKDGPGDPADGEVGSGPPFRMSPRLVDQLLLTPAGHFTKIACERVPEAMVARPFAGEYIARWARTEVPA